MPARGMLCLRFHSEQVLTRRLPGAGKAVEVLLNRHNFSLDNTDTSGLTPLHWAAAKGKLACLAKFLLRDCVLSIQAASGPTSARGLPPAVHHLWSHDCRWSLPEGRT